MPVTDTQKYSQSVTQLEKALSLGKPYLPLELQRQGHQILSAAKERLALGVDHTIVALAGGTGSGKSSTFNALSGLEFADVGVRRPTTVRTAACTWDSDATALLDWIGVDSDRRISRDTALDGAEQAALKGLILLDLPDHDSIAEHHKEIVKKVLPLVDVLIWVIDPQKYADEALHAEFLREMVDARASMIVVLNQIDTVPSELRPALLADVFRLLEEDGLQEVPVRQISARTREGISSLKDELRLSVARKSMASRRLNDELLRLARLIDDQVPSGVSVDLSTSLRGEADRYLVAAGVPALADEVSERFARDETSGSAPTVQVPSETTLSGLRSRWLDRVTNPLREGWAKPVRARAGNSSDLMVALKRELATVTVPWGPIQGVSRFPTLVAFALSGILLILGVLAFAQVFGGAAAGAILVVLALLVGVIGWILIRRRAAKLRTIGREKAEQLREECAAAVGVAVNEVLFAPVAPILSAHEEISLITDHVIASNIAPTVTDSPPTKGS